VFGHPEVYILILPAFGIVSEIMPVFSRKPLFGYAAMVFALAFIAVLGFGVWSHHMFATGMGPVADTVFSLATMLIAIPTGVKIFNWMGTAWGGSLQMKTPMYFALGFIAMFIIGGLSGVMHSAAPADLQQTDTYFVVAHFHYVLIGGLISAVFGGIFYWFGKFTGRMLNETLGKAFFWVFLLGWNLTFMPMHWTGLLGMPRRVFTYSSELGVDTLNLVSSIGGGIQAIAILLLIANILYSLKRGPKAPNNPWHAPTLEWATTSPPAEHNFNRIPTVHTREPLWLEREQIEAATFGEIEPMHMPPPSWWPIFTAAGVMLTFIMFLTPFWWAPLVGLAVTMLGVINWGYEPV
jgi:cytochrome c oxidase subunit 1